MNRHQRRKAKALRKLGQKGDGAMVVPVHESGHAIAKVLAIGEFGYSIDKAIDYIDIGTGQNLGQSADRKMILQSQAVTVGHTFSKDIETASREFKLAYFAEHGHEVLQGAQNEFLSKIVELGRAAGADIGKWFRARVFDAVSGSIAEAIFTEQTFEDVWYGYQAEDDQLSVAQDARVSGISIGEAISTINRMAALSAYLMEKRAV
jgi:hypothetical protein